MEKILMHVRPLTKVRPAQAASLEVKLDIVNQIVNTIRNIMDFVEDLGS